MLKNEILVLHGYVFSLVYELFIIYMHTYIHRYIIHFCNKTNICDLYK